MPKASIILPVYNGEKHLPRAVESVLRQRFRDWELIIVDDGSKDRSGEIAEDFARKDPRIKVLHQQNSGIQKALNAGLARARGGYIARIDDDDEWLETGKLQVQIDFLDTHKNHVLVGTGAIVKDESGRELFRYLPPAEDSAIRNRMLMRNCFIHSSVLFRSAPIRELGGYPESRETLHVEDYDLWLRLGTGGKMANLPIYSTGFTLRPGNLSSMNKTEQFRKDMELIRKYRTYYPGYFRAIFVGRLRLAAYRIYCFMPERMRSILLRRYKQF